MIAACNMEEDIKSFDIDNMTFNIIKNNDIHKWTCELPNGEKYSFDNGEAAYITCMTYLEDWYIEKFNKGL